MWKPGTALSGKTEIYRLLQSGLQQARQVQLSVTQQLGRTATLYLSGSHQTYWGTDDADEQLQAGLNAAVDDINWSLSYSLTKTPAAGARSNAGDQYQYPFSHWLRSDSRSVWRHASASYSLSHDLNGRMTNLAGLYGTLLEDNNLSYSMQTGYAGGSNGDNGSTGYTALNYRGGYGNANVGYSRSDGFKQLSAGSAAACWRTPTASPEPTVKRYRGAGESPGAGGVKVEKPDRGTHRLARVCRPALCHWYRENRIAGYQHHGGQCRLDDAVVSVVPTHGAIVAPTLTPGGDEDPDDADPSRQTGAVWRPRHRRQQPERHRRGQRRVYLSGMPLAGKVRVKWGDGPDAQCVADYRLPPESQQQALSQLSVACR